MTRRITVVVVLVAVVLLVGWDVYAVATREDGATISEVLRDGAASNPFVSFAFGVLMGHLFWPLRRDSEEGDDGA